MVPESVYKCLIVDDTDIDRLTIQAFVKKQPSLQLLQVFDNPIDVLAFLKKETVDVIFLDVDMPMMKGTELRKQLTNIPACIFVTSYPDYAVDAFELEALDFILKPLKANRFEQTMQRLQAFMEVRQKAALFEYTLGGDAIFIKEGTNHIKIKLHEVLYLEALKDYTRLVTSARKYTVLGGIQQMLAQPEFSNFIRVHRSYAAQRHYISKVDSQQVYIGTISLPLGRTYKPDIEKIIVGTDHQS